MEILSEEHQLILYKSVMEIAKICEFNTFNKVFYCGTRLKWVTPNTLLIIIDEDPDNRFYLEMSSEKGSTCFFYLNHYRDGCHFKVITQKVYDYLKTDWCRLADKSWVYPENMKYIPGIDITNIIKRYHNIKAFL